MEFEPVPKLKLDKRTARVKAEHFCAYQERSQQEVRDKLYTYGIYPTEVEEIISELIEANFLNEGRFANAFALGKFRMKSWGKYKIKQALKQKRVGDNLIKKALSLLDAEGYEERLLHLLEKKHASISETNAFKRKQKLISYALAKGYEKDIILDCLNSSTLL